MNTTLNTVKGHSFVEAKSPCFAPRCFFRDTSIVRHVIDVCKVFKNKQLVSGLTKKVVAVDSCVSHTYSPSRCQGTPDAVEKSSLQLYWNRQQKGLKTANTVSDKETTPADGCLSLSQERKKTTRVPI